MSKILYHLTIFLSWVANYNANRDIDEGYRDEFEAEAVRSGDFKGIRFTQKPNGDYVDPRLQQAWEKHLMNTSFLDRAI